MIAQRSTRSNEFIVGRQRTTCALKCAVFHSPRLCGVIAARIMPSIRILAEDDVRAAIDSDRALELARVTLRDQARGNSELSTPSAMSLDATRFGAGRF